MQVPITQQIIKFLYLLSLLVGLPYLWAVDVERSPTEEDFRKIEDMGWEAARDAVAKELELHYQPATAARPGSLVKPVFSEWMDIWRVLSILAQSEKAAMGEFLSHYCFRDTSGTQRFIPIGGVIPEDAVRVDPQTAEKAIFSKEVMEELLPDYHFQEGLIADRAGMELASHLLRDQNLRTYFLDTLSDEDCLPAVMEGLKSIQEADPVNFQKFPGLAIALAVVWDVRLPRSWPHHQVAPSKVPIVPLPIAQRFAFWIASQKQNRLWNDLSKMDAQTLKFVVDTPVSIEELQWAQKNVRQPKSSFERVFSSIKYQYARIKSQTYDWPDGEYTLDAISKQGGICVDQAYFAMLSGKARGIPTLFFTGQGADGGHAWFGYLKSGDRWDLDCGRYENQKYATGEALDPQTWQSITDHDLKRFVGNQTRRSDDLPTARRELAWSKALFKRGDSEQAGVAVDSGLRAAPGFWPLWEQKATYLKGASLADRKDFWESARKQFASDKDLLVLCQKQLAALAYEAGDKKTAGAYETKMIRQNRLGRSDLSISAASEKIQAALSEGDKDSADQIYRQTLRTLGKTGGGELFYTVVRPFVTSQMEQGDKVAAKRALEDAKRALQPSPDSILDQEFKTLEKTISSSR